MTEEVKTMKYLLIRADDLGYSEGVNYGIAAAVAAGLVRSVGVMTNMPAAVHGLGLLHGHSLCLGQHTNICVGRPLTDPSHIPSLCTPEGEYFEGHAVASANFFKGLEIVAQHHGLPYFAMGRPGEAVIFRHTRVYAYMPRDFKAYEADPFTGVQDAVAHAHEGACDLMVFHPGYIDAYLLDHSTMTTPRVREAAMLCRPEVRAWLEQQDIHLVTYNDLT